MNTRFNNAERFFQFEDTAMKNIQIKVQGEKKSVKKAQN